MILIFLRTSSHLHFNCQLSCSVNWESHTFNAMTYILFLFFFGLIVPVCVISYSYVKIVLTMRENTIRNGKVNKMETKVTMMIAVMILGEFCQLNLTYSHYFFLIFLTNYFFDSLVSFFGCMDTVSMKLNAIILFSIALFGSSQIQHIRSLRTIWWSWINNTRPCRSASTHSKIEYML